MSLVRLDDVTSPELRDELLSNLKFDSVHPSTINNPNRLGPNRDIFLQLEGDITTFVLCVAYVNLLPDHMDDIFVSEQNIIDPNTAIFYTIFKTDHIDYPVHKAGWLILSASAWIKENRRTITNFTTMSPIPTLRKTFVSKTSTNNSKLIQEYLITREDPVSRFHLKNGATVMRIVPDADDSDLRQEQSWGCMANYDYTSLVNTL